VVLLLILSIAEAVILGMGVFLPFAYIKEFWLFKSEFSVFSLVVTLIESKNFLLGFSILIFGVLIPIFRLLTNNFPITFLRKLNLHRLAMLDLFLASFLVFSSQSSYFFEVTLLKGFYFLLIAALISYFNFWLRAYLKSEVS
tara:strand:- start:155 stop:580 length:426 start_codon:yes stop_codon:yes gene_type:complete